MDVIGQKILDRELCWNLWIQPGMSLTKVREELARRGVRNRQTGAPPAVQSIEKAAFAHLCESPKDIQEKCKEQFRYCMETTQAWIVTDEEWTRWMVDKARLIYAGRKKKFDAFIARNGFQEYVTGNR